jgi:hypothetical protein
MTKCPVTYGLVTCESQTRCLRRALQVHHRDPGTPFEGCPYAPTRRNEYRVVWYQTGGYVRAAMYINGKHTGQLVMLEHEWLAFVRDVSPPPTGQTDVHSEWSFEPPVLA